MYYNDNEIYLRKLHHIIPKTKTTFQDIKIYFFKKFENLIPISYIWQIILYNKTLADYLTINKYKKIS